MHENIRYRERAERAGMQRTLSQAPAFLRRSHLPAVCRHLLAPPPWQRLGLQEPPVMPLRIPRGSCSDALCSILSSAPKASKERSRNGWKQRLCHLLAERPPSSEECGEGRFQRRGRCSGGESAALAPALALLPSQCVSLGWSSMRVSGVFSFAEWRPWIMSILKGPF